MRTTLGSIARAKAPRSAATGTLPAGDSWRFAPHAPSRRSLRERAWSLEARSRILRAELVVDAEHARDGEHARLDRALLFRVLHGALERDGAVVHGDLHVPAVDRQRRVVLQHLADLHDQRGL